MDQESKLQMLRAVESSPLSVTEALAKLDLPATTYYHWRTKFRQQGVAGLEDLSPYKGRADPAPGAGGDPGSGHALSRVAESADRLPSLG